MLYVIYSTHGAEPVAFTALADAEDHARELRQWRAYRDVALYVIPIDVHKAWSDLANPATARVD